MTNEEMVQHIQQGENKKEYLARLYAQNKGLVYTVIRKYKSLEPVEDLMQEGYIGLQKAAELFDQNEGVLFSTFAILVIDHAVNRYINMCGSMIRVPEYQKRTIAQYKRIEASYRAKLNREPSQEEVFYILGLRKSQGDVLKRIFETRSPRSLSEPIGGEPESPTLEETIKDPKNKIDNLIEEMNREELKRELWREVDALGDPQAGVIRARFQDGKSLEECGKDLDCRREHVRQIQMRAMATLRSERVKSRIRPYIDEIIYNEGVRSTGLTSYLRYKGSSVERIALDVLPPSRRRRKQYGV